MDFALGLDLGTTTITALAIEPRSGTIQALCTRDNLANITTAADRLRGRSEWDASRMASMALDCLRDLAGQLPAHARPRCLGISGQQHGVLLVDRNGIPAGPFINWQDRRGEDTCADTGETIVELARRVVGEEAAERTGCRLSSGYMAVTLLALAQPGGLPRGVLACSLMDWMVSHLTQTTPVTEASCAASAGVFDLQRGDWANDLIQALGLPRGIFPAVRPACTLAGTLGRDWASSTGLPHGLPVLVGIGDNQASFLGSVADREDSLLVNVGTGGQVSLWSSVPVHGPTLEPRPFPAGGFLIVSAGLAGGAAYATLEGFFRAMGEQVFGLQHRGNLFEVMNRLASTTPAGSQGVVCEPFFAGTRSEPGRRGSWSGLTPSTLLPGHLCRSLLEGVSRTFAESASRLRTATGRSPSRLIGAGNGIRNGPLLASLIETSFGLSMEIPFHREEAAFGAALHAATGVGLVDDWKTAGAAIRYQKLSAAV